MRVLVTGSKGFLGRHVCSELEREGIDYYGWESSRDGDLTNFTNIQEAFSSNPNLRLGFTHICHLAAKCGGISANLKSPYTFIRDNLQMGLNVIDLAIELRAKVIFIGTICSYPETPKTIPFIESEIFDSVPEKSNLPYGIAKRTLMTALEAAKSQHGLDSISLNMGNLYGLFDNDSTTGHFIPEIFRKCVEYKRGLAQQVTLFGDGTATRDMVNVKDGVKAVIYALKLQDGPTDGFGINVGTGIESSIHEIAFYIFELMNVDFDKVVWDKTRPNGQKRRILSTDRLEKYFDWKPQIRLYDGLKELATYYLETI